MKFNILPSSLSGRIALLVVAIFAANIVLTGIFSVQYTKKLQMRETIQTVRALVTHLNKTESLQDVEEFIDRYDIIQKKSAPNDLKPAPFSILKSTAELFNRKNMQQIGFFISEESPDYIWLHYTNPNDRYENWIGITRGAFYEDHPYFIFSQEIIIIMIIIFGSIITAWSISHPIDEINIAAEQFGRGETPKKLRGKGTVETKKLADTFNQMVEDHKMLENERKLMLAGFSHDIRTPLTRIQLSIDMLDSIDAETRKAIKDDIAQITSMQKQFMEYVTAGGDEAFTTFDLTELLHQSVARYAAQVNDTIKLECPETPIMIKAQALNLSRVMCNLIINAIKYGEPPISITCEESDDRITVSVMDRGPGVNAGALKDIFKPMFRENTCRKNADGSGLGLAIVKRIIEKHDGQIYAENLPDGFCIRFILTKRF